MGKLIIKKIPIGDLKLRTKAFEHYKPIRELKSRMKNQKRFTNEDKERLDALLSAVVLKAYGVKQDDPILCNQLKMRIFLLVESEGVHDESEGVHDGFEGMIK